MTTAYIVLDGNLKLALPMDEGSGTVTYDKSGNNNDGTISGATWVDGKYGKALSFDGIDDRVEVAHNANLYMPNGFTLMAWAKPNPPHPEVLGFVAGKGSWAEGFWGFYLDANNKVYYQLRLTGSTIEKGGAIVLPSNVFSHITLVWDTSALKLYVNGVFDNQADAVGSLPNLAEPFVIGRRYAAGYWFSGSIDEVRIYNRALTAAEISDLYNRGGITLRFANINEKFSTKNIILDVPGKTGDFIQSMGKKFKIFDVKGLYIGSTRATDRETLRGALNTNAIFSSEGIPVTRVFIKEINYREKGSRPLEYDVELELVETS